MNRKIKKIVIVIFFIAIVGVGGFKYYMHYEEIHTLNTSQAVAYYSLRLAENELVLGKNVSEFNSNKMRELGYFVKKLDSNNNWFASNTGFFYVKISDTADFDVTWISDGTYYATFYVRKNTKFVEKYTFETGSEKGYEFYIE